MFTIAVLALAAAGIASANPLASSTYPLVPSANSLAMRDFSKRDVKAVVPALYDGVCYYPTSDSSFTDLSKYVGKWFQVAGIEEDFDAGCTCTRAEYGLNSDGSISVYNVCQQPGGTKKDITGSAKPVDKAYGGAGSLQLSFPSIPNGGVTCPGPNYIIMKYDPNWAIVGSTGWGFFALLSRNQNPSDGDVQTWLGYAEKAGINLSLVKRVDQTGCTI